MPDQKAMVASRVKMLAWKTLCCRQWLDSRLTPSLWMFIVLQMSGCGGTLPHFCVFLSENTREEERSL